MSLQYFFYLRNFFFLATELKAGGKNWVIVGKRYYILRTGSNQSFPSF